MMLFISMEPDRSDGEGAQNGLLVGYSRCSFQTLEALHLIRKGHTWNQFVIFHLYSS